MRNPLISFLQVFGICLVVLGHAFPTDGHELPLYRWIYSFHMPLWIFLSGYLLQYTAPGGAIANIRFGPFVRKKSLRLLLPYVAISSLAFLPKVWLSAWAVKPVEATWGDYVGMLLYPARNVIVYYWFLPTIFLLLTGTVLAAKGVRRWRMPMWGWLAAALALSVYNPLSEVGLLNLNGVARGAFFFLLGIAYCRYQPWIDQGLGLQRITTPWLLLALFTPLACGWIPGGENAWINRAVAAAGILFSISLGFRYLRLGRQFFAPLEGSTYPIFLFSWFAQSPIRVVLFDLWHWPAWAGIPVSVAAGIGLPWLFDRLYRRYAPRLRRA